MGDFQQLATVQFQTRMLDAARSIYGRIWPGCQVFNISGGDGAAHVLDSAYGIDCSVVLPESQAVLYIQEKFRSYRFLCTDRLKVEPPWPDFTQEYMNGSATPHERPGEWFSLAAQLYFFGWANQEQTAFLRWVMLDVCRYKATVERLGGLDAVGTLYKNAQHGRASFYAIPIHRLRSAWFCTGGIRGGAPYINYHASPPIA